MPDEVSEAERVELEQFGKLEQLKRDYISTFSTDSGKRVLEHLEILCFVNRTTFSSRREGEIERNEGMRCVVLHIKSMIDMSIERIKKLIKNQEIGG